MSYCLRRLVSRLAAMVATLAMGMATPARADLQIWLSETVNPPGGASLVGSHSAISASYTADTSGHYFNSNLSVNATASSTSSSSPATATITSTITLTNEGSGSLNVYMVVGNNGLVAPSTHFSVSSGTTGTDIGSGSTSSFAFTSYVAQNNGQNSTNPATNSGNQSLGSTTIFTASNVPNAYAMTQRFQITLVAGETITLTAATATSTPEPSTMAIAGLGALGMIGYGGLRRRKAKGAWANA
jgi:MYXO-CTERM domain-containing protein